MLKRAGRRLLVSPWFAAGAGVVIAAGALVYAPHAHFSIGISQCGTTGATSCKPMTQQGVAPALLGPGDLMTPSPSPPSTPVAILYQPQRSSTSSTSYGFSMWIKIPSPPSRWSLSFVIPGASHVYVEGWARWQSLGPGEVTVGNVIAGTESAGVVSITGQHDIGGSGPGPDGGAVLFQVRGTGTLARPAQCKYNGAACVFRYSTELAQGMPG